MRIFYQPQLSMRSYSDNTWLVPNDAQFTKILAYVRALPPDWGWFFLMPGDGQAKPYTHMLPMNVLALKDWWADNVLEMRYHFDMVFAKSQLQLKRPDLILCEVPEHVRAWRVAQRYAGHECPIIAMVEHVDIYEQTRVPELQRFMLRQIDGALAADAVAFPLEGMRREWTVAAMGILNNVQEMFDDITGKSVVWNAIYSPREVDDAMERVAPWGPIRGPVINFISRLSDNQRTHYLEFFQAVQILRDQGEQFTVWVQNPNEAMSRSQIDAFCDVEHFGNSGRDDYIASLLGSNIVPILYPTDMIYSLGHCEAITARNIIVSQYGNSSTEEYSAAVKITDPNDPNELAAGLKVAIDVWHDENLASRMLDNQEDWLEDNRSVEKNIDKVRATIEEVVRSVVGS